MSDQNDAVDAVEYALENPPGKPCYFCGEWHEGKQCPRIKAITFEPGLPQDKSKIARYEFFSRSEMA